MPEIEGPGGLTYTVRDRNLTRVKQGSIAKPCKDPKSIGEFRDNLAVVDFQHLPPAWRNMTVATRRVGGGAKRPAFVFRGDDRDPEKILAAGFTPLIPNLVSAVFRNEKCDMLLPTTVCACMSRVGRCDPGLVRQM